MVLCWSHKNTPRAGADPTVCPQVCHKHFTFFTIPNLGIMTFFQNKISMASPFQDASSWTLSISPGFLSLHPLICVIISAARAELLSAVGYLYFKSFSSQYLPEPFLCFLPLSPCPLKHFSSLSCAANPTLLLSIPMLWNMLHCTGRWDNLQLIKSRAIKRPSAALDNTRQGALEFYAKEILRSCSFEKKGWTDVWVVICSV